MPSIAYDLEFLRAGVPELESYLLSDEIYWPMGGQPPTGEGAFPRLTLGWLLLARMRVRGRDFTPADLHTVENYSRQMEAMRTRWRVAWERKAAREFHSRLRLWVDYLNDYRKNPPDHARRYAYEVNRRVLLHLLALETDDIPSEEVELFTITDKMLWAIFNTGKFVWQPDLQSVFPRETYWYLYGSLRGDATPID